MSGIFPSSPAPSAIEISSFAPTRISESHSLKRQTRTTNAQRWIISLDFSALERDEFAPIFAFLVKQRGRFDTFTYVLPNPLYTPRGAGASGSPTASVDGTQVSPTLDVQSGRSIYTRDWPVSSTVLKAGDFFKYASHSKVYMATDNVASDASGKALVVADPATIVSVSHGDPIVTANVPFTVALARDEAGFSLAPASLFSLRRIDLVEAFS